ncbi:hypothetical protein NLX86_26835 [Streptomyces sp. A3M-1-3]|uniref:hypothetical protein n=1 Tax=Streptomyces sp. A3M-1-3 TaxID=2962044 RepID=UPI0020B6AC90|nr:hypothetical protein [Streptomyces sp. A3M-1-3]MCP3821575.1 hypothetical protein [Streptomyces sp. A3M-1-3]
MHRHRELCEQAVDPLEIAAGLEAHGVTDRTAARFRHRDVFSLAEELYARVPRADAPERTSEPPGRAAWSAVALLPGAVCALAVAAVQATDGQPRLAAGAAGAVAVAVALRLSLRRGPLRAEGRTVLAARLWVCWLLGYALFGDALLVEFLGGGPGGSSGSSGGGSGGPIGSGASDPFAGSGTSEGPGGSGDALVGPGGAAASDPLGGSSESGGSSASASLGGPIGSGVSDGLGGPGGSSGPSESSASGGSGGGDGFGGGWLIAPAPVAGLALAVAPAAWCAGVFDVQARSRLAGSRALEEFAGVVRPLLLGVVALFLAALTALLLLSRLAFGEGALLAPAALGALLFLARLLTVHGFPDAAATGLGAACAAEVAALTSVLAARLPGCGFLAGPVEAAHNAWGPAAVPAAICATAALALLVHATVALSRASAHALPRTPLPRTG